MASTDIDVRTEDMPAVVDPRTGEVLVIAEATTDMLAMFLDNVRDTERAQRAQKAAVTRELLGRMDAEASWTARVGDYVLRGDGPGDKTEYDAEQLYEALSEYVDSGVISEGAREAAVERTYSYKAKARGIRALEKLGGGIADAIRRHSREVPKDRRVSVGRAK
jgi:hypothetical protein